MRRLLRALLGAVWSVPLRLVTIPAIAGSMVLAAGGVLTAAQLTSAPVVLAGVAVSVALRFAENLLIEFAVFPGFMAVFLKGHKP